MHPVRKFSSSFCKCQVNLETYGNSSIKARAEAVGASGHRLHGLAEPPAHCIFMPSWCMCPSIASLPWSDNCASNHLCKAVTIFASVVV